MINALVSLISSKTIENLLGA